MTLPIHSKIQRAANCDKMMGRFPQTLFPRAAGKPGRRKRSALADVTNQKKQKASRKQANRCALESVTIQQFPVGFVISNHQYRGKSYDVDKSDDGCWTDYIGHVYSYFVAREKDFATNFDYMAKQPHIDANMRAKIVHWLVNISDELSIPVEVLYLSVTLVDRFLQGIIVRRTQLPLLAIASLMIAAKFEYRCTPSLNDLIRVSGNRYSRKIIVEMERNILETLNYEIFVPTSFTFLVQYLKYARVCKKTCDVAFYILESSLLSYSLLPYLPSQLASAAVCIARYSMAYHPWSATLRNNTGYCEEDIIPIAREMNNERKILSKKYTAVKRKCIYNIID